MQTNKYLDALNEHAVARCMTKGDKPGPKDPRRTPAPKKDQKKGSKKNKPDSAKDDKGKITFSAKTVEIVGVPHFRSTCLSTDAVILMY